MKKSSSIIFYIVLFSFALLGLSSCKNGGFFPPSEKSTSSVRKQSEYPQTRNEEQLEKMGKIGGDGLFNKLLGFGGSSKSSDGTISVDGYLWRAVVDSTYKFPIERIEPKYGILLTDWYTLPSKPGYRYKLNVYITSDRLHADSIKVSAFKQTKVGADWADSGHAESLARMIEERILFKARALKVQDK